MAANHVAGIIAAKLLRSVGTIKPDRYEREVLALPAMPTVTNALNDFMGAFGRDLWRKHYAMERESFNEWIDLGGES